MVTTDRPAHGRGYVVLGWLLIVIAVVALAVLLIVPARAADPTPATKARVALALDTSPEARSSKAAKCLDCSPERCASRTDRVAAILDATGAESCGVCRDDLDGCRRDAVLGGRTLVVFVGGCESKGLVTAAVGAIPCRVESYDGDGREPADKRIVVVGVTAGKLVVAKTLPPTATAADVAASVRRAAGK